MVMDDATPKNCSYAFGSLSKVCYSFKEELYKRLGNGKIIRLDKDKWHHNKWLKPKNSEDCPSRENLKVVSDLIGSDKMWRPIAIWNNFSKEDAREILITHITQEEVEDGIEWSFTK